MWKIEIFVDIFIHAVQHLWRIFILIRTFTAVLSWYHYPFSMWYASGVTETFLGPAQENKSVVSLTAAYVRERQSERSVRASQIISPVLMHFLTDKLSLHSPPPQLTFVLRSLRGNTRKTWLIEKCRQKNNVSACCLAEVSISGTVNTGPPSIAERLQTSQRSPNKCHRSQSSLYFHCAQCYGVQPSADRKSVKTERRGECRGVKPRQWHFENACFVVGPQCWIVAHPAFKSPVQCLQRCQHC